MLSISILREKQSQQVIYNGEPDWALFAGDWRKKLSSFLWLLEKFYTPD